MLRHIKSLRELLEAFPTEESCLEYIEQWRWKGNVKSPFAEHSKVYKCANGKYICKETRKYFTARTGTVFEKTKIPLRDWFIAIWLMASHKKGISSVHLAQELGIRQASAWYLGNKVRRLLGMAEEEQPVSGIFEIDEMVLGGLNKNRPQSKKIKNSRGAHTPDKTWVLGIILRNGWLRTYVLDTRDRDKTQAIIRKLIAQGSVIITDSWSGYFGLDDVYRHYQVKDGKRCDSETRSRSLHTNAIEGAWRGFKAGYRAIYNWWSKKHIPFYLDEFTFRYNHRKLKTIDRFSLILGNAFKRITYKDIIAA